VKDCLEKFGYTTAKSAVKRRILLKKINKKYGLKYLVEAMNLRIKKIPKSQINKRRILRFDLRWIKKSSENTER